MLTMLRILGTAFLLLMFGEVWAQSQQPPPSGSPTNGPPQTQPQTNQQPTATDQSGAEQSPIFVKVIPTPKTDAEATQDAKDREEKSAADWWIVRWTGAVAIFTFVLACVGMWQGIQLKRSVDILSQAERAQIFIIVRGESIHNGFKAARFYNNSP